MPDLVFARRFLQDLAEWQGSASARDIESLDTALAKLVANPALPGRFLSFYDPERPSYLYRADAVLIQYRVAATGTVEFLNLFFPRG